MIPGDSMSVVKAGEMPALRIRRATAADISAMIAIETHASTAAHWSIEQYRSVLSSAEPPRVALVIEAQSDVQGFIIGRVQDHEWEIENIVVAEVACRRGLGDMLLGGLLDLARDRGAKSVFLEVRESNLAARSLYGKHSFAEVGRRKQYYREPSEDAVLYRLEVS